MNYLIAVTILAFGVVAVILVHVGAEIFWRGRQQYCCSFSNLFRSGIRAGEPLFKLRPASPQENVRRLPKPWMSDDTRMALFDATVGLRCLRMAYRPVIEWLLCLLPDW